MSTTIIRTEHSKNKPYVVLYKKTLEIENLSWEAKGVWSYLLSRPDNWKVSVSHLVAHFPAGRDKVYSIIKELIDVGLCKRLEIRGENGKFLGYEYVMFEEQQSVSEGELKKCLPLPEKPYPVKPYPVKPTLISNDIKQVKNNNNRSLEKQVNDQAPKSETDDVVVFSKKEKEIKDELKKTLGQKLTEQDKLQLLEKYHPDKIKKGIEFYRTYLQPIRNSMGFMIDAIENNREPSKTQEETEKIEQQAKDKQYDNTSEFYTINKNAIEKSGRIRFFCGHLELYSKEQKRHYPIKYGNDENFYTDFYKRLGFLGEEIQNMWKKFCEKPKVSCA